VDDDREPTGSAEDDDPAPAGASPEVARTPVQGFWGQAAAAASGVATSATWALSDAEVLGLLRSQQATLARLEAGRLALIREVETRGLAGPAAACSTAAFLAHDLGADRAVMAADVRAALRLDPDGDTPAAPGAMTAGSRADVCLAETGRALANGLISRAHADAIALHVARLPDLALHPEDPDGEQLRVVGERFLLDHATGSDRALYPRRGDRDQPGIGDGLDPRQLRLLGRHLAHHVDPDGVLADELAAVRTSSVWIRPDSDGTGAVCFGGRTDALTGAQLKTLIDAHSAPKSTRDPDTGDKLKDDRTVDQRRGEAFSLIVRLAANADPSVSGGNSVQLIVTATLETLRSADNATGVRPAVTETGEPLSAAWARQLACDTRIIRMVLGSKSEPLDVGRAQRVVPAAMRKALIARDKGCAFPGCDRPPRWADAHHIIHWSRGGRTASDNLVLLCEYHHQTLHHTAWTVAIVDGLPVFTPPPTTSPNTGRAPPRGNRS
jgi:hypothetical protein